MRFNSLISSEDNFSSFKKLTSNGLNAAPQNVLVKISFPLANNYVVILTDNKHTFALYLDGKKRLPFVLID